MYSVASIKACEFRTTGCFDVPLNQSELIFGLSSKQTIFGMRDLPRDKSMFAAIRRASSPRALLFVVSLFKFGRPLPHPIQIEPAKLDLSF
jgi:hypothetical protein